MPNDNTDLIRYFIFTSGRSGSSLLAAILADTGANFGMSAPSDWDPHSGQMENANIKKAAHHYRRMYDIERGTNYYLTPRIEAHCRRKSGQKYLKIALKEAQYLKIGDMDLLVQQSFSLGYIPRLLLSYRRFEETAVSILRGRKHVGPDQIARDYVRLYRQGLMLVHCFGGCVVNYEDIVNPERKEWIDSISEITKLGKTKLQAVIRERIRPKQEMTKYPVIYQDAYAVFQAMEDLRGKAIEPSYQIKRAIIKRPQGNS